jgi:hypothetical protein
MTNLAWQDGEATEPLPRGVRFAGKSLEQLLCGVATDVRQRFRHDIDISIVVRDSRGGRTWGTAASSPLAVVALPPSNVEKAVEFALDEGRAWQGDHTLAVPIGIAERVIGAVAVTAHGSRSVDAAEVRAARRAADVWALTIDNAVAFAAANTRMKNLEIALQGRAVIEQAKGIVMERHHCGPDEAFEILRDRSQRRDAKLSLIAAQLVAEARA